MVKAKRRSVLKLAGGTALGGMAGILATGRTPAYAQQKTVHWLKWVDFVPATDQMFRKELVPAAEKALGLKINLETVNGNDLQPRITAGIQSGAGPDLIMSFNSYTHLYANSVVDLAPLAEEVGKREGGIFPYAQAICSNGKGVYMGMPWAVIGGMVAYRKSWLDEVGATKFPDNWEDYHAVGKKLKAKGHPFGQTLGHTFGDAPGFTYPYLWSWGGSATLNGASIYIETLRKPDQYKTEKGEPMSKDILHAPLPKGPAGQFGFHLLQSNMLMKYSKNQDAAKEFLKYLHTEANYRRFFESQKGFATPCTAKWESDPLWNVDPVMAPFKVAARLGQAIGFAGPPDAKAQEGLSKYIITDMYAKAVQGMPPEESVKWAESELKKIYAA